jgi:hypothetical protein
MPDAIGSKCCIGTGADYGSVRRQTFHNARKGYLRVLYPYHPYYGQTFEVFGSNGGLRDLVYIRMPNNATRGILRGCLMKRFVQAFAALIDRR